MGRPRAVGSSAGQLRQPILRRLLGGGTADLPVRTMAIVFIASSVVGTDQQDGDSSRRFVDNVVT
jgi:hypothetical protein